MSDTSIGPPSLERAGQVNISKANGTGWIVLDNPRKHNAISVAMWQSLLDALRVFKTDLTVRCVVIRGQGDKAFCAGGDISEKHDVDEETTAARVKLVLDGLAEIHAYPKPLLAMVSGYCLGAGMAIAVACDLRLADDGASFGVPAAKLGLPYNYSEMKRLADLVGPARAKQIVFTADRIAARQALQMGLIDELVSTNELLNTVTRMASRIASNAPLTIAAAKHAVAIALADPDGRDFDTCAKWERTCLTSEDHVEGRQAFMEKRKPIFHGR